MHRLTVFAGPLLSLYALCAVAQTSSPAVSDPQAISLVQQSVTTLTGSTAITDVTLNANVISVMGSDYETGTGIFRAKPNGESRIDLTLSGGTRTDVRSVLTGTPIGAWRQNGGKPVPYAQHNCWTDAAWFSPPFSSLAQFSNLNFVFKYIGPEQHNGVAVQHIQVFQIGLNDGGLVQRLSTLDFYLSSNSNLPLAIAFNAHDDSNMNVNVPTELDFANYQSVNGIQVPFHFQQIVNGTVVLDVRITGAVFNVGLSDSLFSLQ